jgi:hypothetical protein
MIPENFQGNAQQDSATRRQGEDDGRGLGGQMSETLALNNYSAHKVDP